MPGVLTPHKLAGDFANEPSVFTEAFTRLLTEKHVITRAKEVDVCLVPPGTGRFRSIFSGVVIFFKLVW